jgi:hypothetical protein
MLAPRCRPLRTRALYAVFFVVALSQCTSKRESDAPYFAPGDTTGRRDSGGYVQNHDAGDDGAAESGDDGAAESGGDGAAESGDDAATESGGEIPDAPNPGTDTAVDAAKDVADEPTARAAQHSPAELWLARSGGASRLAASTGSRTEPKGISTADL